MKVSGIWWPGGFRGRWDGCFKIWVNDLSRRTRNNIYSKYTYIRRLWTKRVRVPISLESRLPEKYWFKPLAKTGRVMIHFESTVRRINCIQYNYYTLYILMNYDGVYSHALVAAAEKGNYIFAILYYHGLDFRTHRQKPDGSRARIIRLMSILQVGI